MIPPPYGQASATRTEEFLYDGELRLTQASQDTGGFFGRSTQSYTLDGVGNRVAHSESGTPWAYDENNRLRKIGQGDCGTDAAICYDYDEAGNRTAKTEGNQETRYRYDSLNRLTEVRRRTGTDGTETLIARYGYDPQNRRLWKEQYWDRTGQALNPARRTYYLYADEGLIAEAEQDISLGQDGSLTAAGQPQITKQYGIKPGNPFTTGLLFVKTKDTRGETTFAYYHHDHLGVPLQATDRQPA